MQAPNSAPIQSHISNWERDLVASRSAARASSEARMNTAQWATIGATVVGVGALLVGQVHIALAVWGVGILLSPGNKPTDRNDPR